MSKSPSGFFGTAARSNTLLAVYMLGETYPAQVAEVLGLRVYLVQRAIESLEEAGMVVSGLEGNQRRVKINPRLIYKTELEALLQKMSVNAVDLQKKMAEYRRRPRRIGKEL